MAPDPGDNLEPFPSLVGNRPPLTTTAQPPAKTVGSYWPHVTTAFDYIRRAMPFGEPQSLTDDELYSLMAYLLQLNKIVDEEATLDRDSLVSVKMPNSDGFICDARPDAKYLRCMNDCKIFGEPGFDMAVNPRSVLSMPTTDCMLTPAQ